MELMCTLSTQTLDQLGALIQGELATTGIRHEVPRTFVRGSIALVEAWIIKHPKKVTEDDLYLLDRLKKAMES